MHCNRVRLEGDGDGDGGGDGDWDWRRLTAHPQSPIAIPQLQICNAFISLQIKVVFGRAPSQTDSAPSLV